jgi:hypothetical protein
VVELSANERYPDVVDVPWHTAVAADVVGVSKMNVAVVLLQRTVGRYRVNGMTMVLPVSSASRVLFVSVSVDARPTIVSDPDGKDKLEFPVPPLATGSTPDTAED